MNRITAELISPFSVNIDKGSCFYFKLKIFNELVSFEIEVLFPKFREEKKNVIIGNNFVELGPVSWNPH